MHVHECELLGTSVINPSDIAVVASPDELNYEDLLIAELLNKDWDAEITIMNKIHPTILADVEASNKSDASAETSRPKAPTQMETTQQRGFSSEVSDSQSRELTSQPQATGSVKMFFRGETSRHMREQSPKQTLSEAKAVNVESEEEDEPTPTSNCFQSLEDLKTEDILHQLENTQDITKITKGTEPRRKKEPRHTILQEESQKNQ
ncbi:UNVERIFIED_CONTAM: hypothetical protein Slati_3486300 [Sesamum latifolium]|uniref:Uncharacterized protein n=1 Tax=Sesamum latifolium TaxID=2727402 RepID=A0AAW2UGX4_9LAMI